MNLLYISNIEKYNNKLFGLIKITDYTESLLDGDIYMNNLKRYIEMEKESGIKGIGDKFEASHVLSDLTLKMTDPQTGKIITMGTCSQMTFKYNGHERKPIYCMLALHGSLLKVIDEDKEYYYTDIDLSKINVDKIIEEFGNKMVLVNTIEFERRLTNKLEEEGYSYKTNLVKYDDFTMNSANRLDAYRSKGYETLFWKDEYFSNQHEYRVVITNKEIEEPLIINIGDIRDISTVYRVDDFFAKDYGLRIKKHS